MSRFTSFLFAMPTALDGVGSVLDMSGELPEFNSSDSPEEADNSAIMLDWMAIAEDIRFAASTVSGRQ